MTSYRLAPTKGYDTDWLNVFRLTKDEIKSILLDNEKIDFRKISSGYWKIVTINGELYRINRV